VFSSLFKLGLLDGSVAHGNQVGAIFANHYAGALMFSPMSMGMAEDCYCHGDIVRQARALGPV
jgi:hypothetical protein